MYKHRSNLETEASFDAEGQNGRQFRSILNHSSVQYSQRYGPQVNHRNNVVTSPAISIPNQDATGVLSVASHEPLNASLPADDGKKWQPLASRGGNQSRFTMRRVIKYGKRSKVATDALIQGPRGFC